MAFTSKNLQYKKGGLSFLKGATFFFLGMSCVLFMTQAFDITPVVTQIQSYFKSIILTPNGTNTAATGISLDGSGGNAYFAGNVGIGTTGPSTKLEVNGTGKFNQITFPGGSNIMKENTSPYNMHVVWWTFLNWDYGNIILTQDGSPKWWEVGIWIGSPSAKLHIHGTTWNIPLLSVTKNSDSYFHIAAAGRVGIGTGSPAEKLDVNGTGKFTSVKVGSNLSLYSALYYSNFESLKWINFNTDGSTTPKMTITTDGKVGIGTWTPSTKLHVAWATKIDASIQIWHEDCRCDQYSDRWTIVYTEMCSAIWGTLTYTPAFLWCVGSWANKVSKKIFMTWTSWTEAGGSCVAEVGGSCVDEAEIHQW